jgi:hypothetical protein
MRRAVIEVYIVVAVVDGSLVDAGVRVDFSVMFGRRCWLILSNRGKHLSSYTSSATDPPALCFDAELLSVALTPSMHFSWSSCMRGQQFQRYPRYADQASIAGRRHVGMSTAMLAEQADGV